MFIIIFYQIDYFNNINKEKILGKLAKVSNHPRIGDYIPE